MNLIKKWLDGTRNYYVGAVLYNQFGNDSQLKKYFSGSKDPVRQQKLEKELTALAGSLPTNPVKADRESSEMPLSADTILEALRNEWQPLYQRINYLRHEIDRYPGEAQEVVKKRLALAREVLELEQQCMNVWDRRDHYLTHGQIDQVKSRGDLPTDPVKLGQLVETLRRNIRRNKLKAKQNPDKTKYPALVKRDEEILAMILKKGNDGK
ncbi:MAG: hypothetical protein ACTHMV_13515 [Chitinophagaceae bacterium]